MEIGIESAAEHLYINYGILGLIIGVILVLLWRKKEFFLLDKPQDIEIPCCERRSFEIKKMGERMLELEKSLNVHVRESELRVFSFAQFQAAQLEINKNNKETNDDLKHNLQSVFNLVSEIKNMMINRGQ